MLSFKNLWRRKIRTGLTILGIAVGVAAVVLLSAFGEGMANGFGTASSSSDADLLVSQRDAMMLMLGAIDEDVGRDLLQIRGIDEAAGSVVGILSLPESPYFLVNGEDPRSFALDRYKLISGRAIVGRREIMLGRQSADNLNKQIGEKFRLNEISYQVVGIYETGASFEDNGAVIGLEDAQRSFDKRRQVSFFKIKLRDVRERDAIKDLIETRWPDLAAVRSGDPSSQDDILQVYRSMGWVLGLFAVLVGGLGMMNAQLMSVVERTREIGVLRAMGWRRWRVVRMLLAEAMIVALVGGLIGLAIGFGGIVLGSRSAAVGGLLQGTFQPMMAVQALTIALVLGVVGGGYPAWRAARLAPVEAMRSESGASVKSGPITRFLGLFLRGNAARNLLRRPARSLMTMAGLGLGVGFIVALNGIGVGVEDLMTDMLSAGQADILVEQAGASDAAFSSIDERSVTQLALHPAVKSTSSMVFGTANVPGLPFFIVFGVDPREGYIDHYRVREGRSIQRTGELILGRMAANGLEKQVGDTLRMAGSSFTIVGIYESGVSYEDAGGVVTLKEAQRMFGKPRQVSFVSVSLHEPERASEIAAELERRLPELMVAPTADLTERMQDFAAMDAAFGALSGLMLLVGGIVMMNVMLMSVFERTREIGVLRALGWGSRRVLGTVLGEALILGVLSAAAGIAIGIGLNGLIGLIPAYGDMLTPKYTPELLTQVVVMALGLGVVGGLIPAWRAIRLSPLEALRYE